MPGTSISADSPCLTFRSLYFFSRGPSWAVDRKSRSYDRSCGGLETTERHLAASVQLVQRQQVQHAASPPSRNSGTNKWYTTSRTQNPAHATYAHFRWDFSFSFLNATYCQTGASPYAHLFSAVAHNNHRHISRGRKEADNQTEIKKINVTQDPETYKTET